MPAFNANILRSNLLSVLQGTLNGDTSTVRVGNAVFNTTVAGDQLNLEYDAPITAKGSLSVGVGALSSTVVLEDASQASQFRGGDAVQLIHTNGTATALTVRSVSSSNQSVTFTGAPGLHPPGSVLVRPATTAAGAQPGGVASVACDGAPLDNMAVAAFLQAVEDWAGNNPTNYGRYASDGVITDLSTQTNLVIDATGGAPGAFVFVNAQSLIGATCTFTATTAPTGAVANQRAKVTGVTVGATVTLTLDNFQDAPDADGNRADLTQWGAVPVAGNTFDLDLDLSSHDKLAALGVAGGDMSTLVSAILTMHRKLDPAPIAGTAGEIPQRWEDAVWQVARGTTLRLTSNPNLAATAIAFTAGAVAVAVEMDGAVGDIPFPLSGSIRLISQADNVNSAGGEAPAGVVGTGGTNGFVAYTRNRRSNVLNCAATPDAGVNFRAGTLVELQGTVNGFTTNKGFSPTIDNKQLSGILWELARALDAYIVLEGR